MKSNFIIFFFKKLTVDIFVYFFFNKGQIYKFPKENESILMAGTKTTDQRTLGINLWV